MKVLTIKDKIQILGRIRKAPKGLTKAREFFPDYQVSSILHEDITLFLLLQIQKQLMSEKQSLFLVKLLQSLGVFLKYSDDCLDCYQDSTYLLFDELMNQKDAIASVFPLNDSFWEQLCGLMQRMKARKASHNRQECIQEQVSFEEKEQQVLLQEKKKLQQQKQILMNRNQELEKKVNDLCLENERLSKLLKKQIQCNHQSVKREEQLEDVYDALKVRYNQKNQRLIQQERELKQLKHHLNLVEYECDAVHPGTLFEGMDKVIIEELYQQSCTLDELVKRLRHRRYLTDAQTVYQRLLYLSNRIGIEGISSNQIPAVYRIRANSFFNECMELQISDYSRPYEMLLFSDTHFVIKNPYFSFQILDAFTDYATQHGISSIFCLGDFVTTHQKVTHSLEQFYQVEDCFHALARKMPVDDRIIYGFLGGNHDTDFLRMGLDINHILTLYHPNFYHLGYTHAFLKFTASKPYFGLHHPNLRLKVEENILNPTMYLKKYYSENPVMKGKVAFDFFGHNHCSYVEPDLRYALVPSLTRDRFQNGAWHLRVYFTPKRDVMQLELIPLVYDGNIEALSSEWVDFARTRRK